MQRYVCEQLVLLPDSSQQFDRFDVAAHGAFVECLLHDRFPIHDMPSVLYTNLIHHSNKKSDEFIAVCRKCLCITMLETLQCVDFNNLPLLEELLEATL